MHYITTDTINIEQIGDLLKSKETIALSDEVKEKITACRAYLDKKIETVDVPIYGITTGFGSLCNVSISKDELCQLQNNLVKSHSCGMGEEVPQEIVRLMLLLKIQNMSYGHSGVQLATVQRMVDFYNHEVYPVVYQQGSLGASGDLAPLAHLALPIIGYGEVHYKGKTVTTEALNKELGWQPIALQSKEGLALLNGTQFMSSYAVHMLIKMKGLMKMADTIAAVSVDAYDGRIEPFHPSIHRVRHHQGQQTTAAHIRKMLAGSEIANQHKEHVQDPYSFRCIPQVHGAAKDAIDYVTKTVNNEINAVTDNPTIFPDEDIIISGGNFHGEPLAIALDTFAIAIAELGSISERRINQLVLGKRGLPGFLVAEPGLNSGFMIPQYAAASIVSQNKQLCTPCSVDSIDSSQGQEDHVSMGANGATKTYRVLYNVEKVLAIELFNAVQALEFRKPLRSSPAIEKLIKEYRKMVPFVKNDTIMHELMKKSVTFIQYNC